MTLGYELRNTKTKGEGIYATQNFKKGELVMIGKIEKELKESHSHSSQIGLNRHVFHGELISKVNHSCNPNCGIHVNATGAHDFCARRHIEDGEEITFDYAMRNYSIEHFPGKCFCGSKNCRGVIDGWKSLNASQKDFYKGFVAPYLLELDKNKFQAVKKVLLEKSQP